MKNGLGRLLKGLCHCQILKVHNEDGKLGFSKQFLKWTLKDKGHVFEPIILLAYRSGPWLAGGGLGGAPDPSIILYDVIYRYDIKSVLYYF